MGRSVRFNKDNFIRDCEMEAMKQGVSYDDIYTQEKYKIFLKLKFSQQLQDIVYSFAKDGDDRINLLISPAEVERIMMIEMLGWCLSSVSFKDLHRMFKFLENGRKNIQEKNNADLKGAQLLYAKQIKERFGDTDYKRIDEMKKVMVDFDLDSF